MATTGPKLTIPFLVGAGQIVGQGNSPEAWILYSTDDASETAPRWGDATGEYGGAYPGEGFFPGLGAFPGGAFTAGVRSFSSSRGRGSEIGEMEAGTATIVLNNRTRAFDPTYNPEIGPLNRWWIREQFSGETQDIFKGYADSYDQQWPAPGFSDALAIVNCTDEFKVLALDHLPTMNPPRDSYEDIITFDQPTGYWPMNDDAATLAQRATIGTDLSEAWPGTMTSLVAGAVVGAKPADSGFQALTLSNSARLSTHNLSSGESGDASGGLDGMAVELWFKAASSAPAFDTSITNGPLAAGGVNVQWELLLTTAGIIRWSVENSASALVVVNSPSAITANSWYHVVGVVLGGTSYLFINGVQVSSAAFAGTIKDSAFGAFSKMSVGDSTATVTFSYDEIAFYRLGLKPDRVQAHYVAGTQRGFPEQRSGVRTGAILDSVSSHAPRSLMAGVRDIQPVFTHGQSPLEEIRNSVRGEAVDGVFFAAKDGTLIFLDASHRSVSPWNTVQATFDDDGTDLPYLDVDIDYSESFLFNEWNVTRDGGTLQTASDTTSIGRYFKRSQSLTGLPVRQDSDALNIATALLAKTKDPMLRVLSLSLDTSLPAVTEAVFRRDLGDRIRIFRTVPGGGARLDATVWIQQISIEADNSGRPWRVSWVVSPL